MPLRREEICLNTVAFATATCPTLKGRRREEICLNAVAYQQLQRVPMGLSSSSFYLRAFQLKSQLITASNSEVLYV